MYKNSRKNPKKWISSFLVATMLTAYLPFEEIPRALAESQSNEATTTSVEQAPIVKTRKEIQSFRTEDSKTYLNPDGTYTSEISQTPIHFKNEQNIWQTINNDLVSDTTEGVYENKANAFDVKFDPQQTPNTPIMKIEEDNLSVALELEPFEHTGEEPAKVNGIVKENSIEYADVYSNVDIKYSVGNDRVKEDIIYREKPSNGFPSQFTYKMNLSGLYVKDMNGILYLMDKQTNEPVYYFETPYMYDSYQPEGFQSAAEITSVPEEAISYDVKLNYEVIDNQLYLNIVPNKQWLEDTERVFPITIDPTIVRLQSSTYVEDTNLRSAFPAQTGGNDLEIGGGLASGNILRSLIKFDLSSIPSATIILSSSLDLWFSSTNGSSPINISLYKASRSWVENQASWNYAMTSPSTAWTTPGGDYLATKLATVTGLTTPTALDNEMKKWEIDTSVIQGWKDSPTSNYGFLLKSDTEGTNIYKKFISSEHTAGSQYHPLLVVTYRTNARLGLEDYWVYDSHPLLGGSSYSNLTTDNNVVQYTDFSLKGKGGFGLDFTRTYNSKSKERSVMGYGWTFTGNEKLFLNIKGTANILDYQDADGTDHEFTYDGPTATYYSGPGKYLTIKKSTTDSTIYTMEDKFGVKTTYKIFQTNSDTNVQVANIITKEDRHGNQIRYAYDAANNNRITSISTADIDNNVITSMTFNYDPIDGYVQSISYGGGTFTFNIEDATGYVQWVDQLKDTTSTRTAFTYSLGQMTRITDPKGRLIDYKYQNGYLHMVQDPQIVDGVTDPDNRPGITYSIDNVNKISTVTQPEGTVTTYYTDDNYVAKKIVEDGVETIYVRDTDYNPETISENGNTTTNVYDLNGNLLSTTDPTGLHTTKYTYTTFSNVATMEDSNHNVTTYSYKSNGDLDTILFPDGGTEKYVFDKYGDLDTVTHPDGSIDNRDFSYSTGLTTNENTDAFGNKYKTVTDPNGNVLETSDGKLNKYTFKYNKKNELEKVTDPRQKETNYAYDSNGNLKSITNAKGKLTTFEYDGQNQLTKEIDPLHQLDQKGITYQYDDNGNLTQTTLLNGHSIVNQYDYTKNQLTNISVKEGTESTMMWEFTYDLNDRISRVCKVTPCDSDTKAQKVFRYNADDSLDSVTDRGNLIDYTDLGSQQQVKYTVGSDFATLDYFLNNMNQLQEIQRTNKDNITTTLATFAYEQGGLPKSVTYNNGGSMQMSYIKNRLDKFEVYYKTSTLPDITYMFGYDTNQNITKITSNAGTTDYAYDELNQLTQEKLPDGTIIDYVYDEVGNRTGKSITKSGVTTTTSYGYNDGNQLIQVGTQGYQYDSNGNLFSDGTKTYVFNDFNELIEIKENNQTIASYTYDEEGKRISSYTPSSGTINFFYDGDKVLYETDSNNNVLREYTYKEGGTPLTMTMNGSMYYYLFNHHGDIIGLTDSQGNVVASYTYDAWGNILTQTGPMASVNPYRYTGYRYDENTKLYYLMARYYNPDTGVFLSLDPVRGDMMDPITQNGYNYANNNPVMMVDPDGKQSKLVYALTYGFNKWVKGIINFKDIATISALTSIVKDVVFGLIKAIKGGTSVFQSERAFAAYKSLITGGAAKTAMRQIIMAATRVGLKLLIGATAFALTMEAIVFGVYAAEGWRKYEKIEKKKKKK